MPNRATTSADFQRAGVLVDIAILATELIAMLLVTMFLHEERIPLLGVINFQASRLRAYLIAASIALLPTLATGWLYGRAQATAGIETDLSRLGQGETVLWYVVTPIAAAFLEETVWRGYAIPRLQGTWRSLLLTSLSFAMFHGIFNPLALVATFLQGMLWGWVYRYTESTVPSMVLHFLSRYLALVL